METYNPTDSQETEDNTTGSDADPEPEPAGIEEPARKIIDIVGAIIENGGGSQFISRVEKSLGGAGLQSVSLYSPGDSLNRIASVRSRDPLPGAHRDDDYVEKALIDSAVVRNDDGSLRVVRYIATDPSDQSGWVPMSEAETAMFADELAAAPPYRRECDTIGHFKCLDRQDQRLT